MKNVYKMVFFLVAVTSISSFAENLNKAQHKVWDVVLKSYDDINKKDINWVEKWVTKDAMVWGGSSPMPRSRNETKLWDKFNFADGSTNNVSTYSPVAIVVHGDTAVAHYYYSNGTTSKSGKQKITNGRCTDILVKDRKSWKFVAWHCTDEPKKS